MGKSKNIDPFQYLQEYADEINYYLDEGRISDDNAVVLLTEMYKASKEIKSKKIDKRISDKLEKMLRDFLK